MIFMSRWKQLEQIVFASFHSCSKFSGRFYWKSISFGIISSFKFSIIKFTIRVGFVIIGLNWLLLFKKSEERCFLWRIMQLFRLGFFVDVVRLRYFLLEMEFMSEISTTLSLFFDKKISWKFIFINFDEINSIFRFAEAMMVVESRVKIVAMNAFGGWRHLFELWSGVSLFSGNKLIVIHEFILYTYHY